MRDGSNQVRYYGLRLVQDCDGKLGRLHKHRRGHGGWKNANECPAKVEVLNWEETDEQVREKPHPFPVTAFFLSHGRGRRSATSGVIDTTCVRTLAGTRWFENFEVELKRHATPVEVVPENETFRLDLEQSRRVLTPSFSWLLWSRLFSF